MMNSWSNTASASKSGALFPTNGKSSYSREHRGHVATSERAKQEGTANQAPRNGEARRGVRGELTTPPARATSLMARAGLEAARRRGLAVAERATETDCGAAARALAAWVGAEETVAAAE